MIRVQGERNYASHNSKVLLVPFALKLDRKLEQTICEGGAGDLDLHLRTRRRLINISKLI